MRAIILLLLFTQIGLLAQPATTSDALQIPQLTFKVNIAPLLIPFKQAAAFATDIRLAPRWSIDLGAGAFFNSTVFASTEGESYTGLRTRAGVKRHFSSVEQTTFYAGLEGKYQDIRHRNIMEVFRQGRQYVEWYTVRRNVRTGGVAARVGWQHYMGKNKRLLLDQFVGLGIDFNRVQFDLPPDAEIAETGGLITLELPEGNSRRASFLLGLHIGFVLW